MGIEELLARQEIVDLSSRYMRGLDRLDAPMMASVFHGDATVDYGFFKGGAADFVDFAQNILKSHQANHHMLGQILIEIDGASAVGEVYFQAYHRIVDDGEPKDLFIAGRYLDRYELRNGSWGISFRAEVNDWARTEPAADEALSADMLLGARQPEDASYKLVRLSTPLRR